MEKSELYHRQTLPNLRLTKPSHVSIPKKIGPYQVDSVLHRGTMSVIFLGTHPETKALIAIKVLSPDLISHPEMKLQFLSEAKIISLADHPNIIKVHGQGEWEKGLYIAMEFIQGLSLRQFITGQPLPLKRSLDIILQVSYALLHLHTHGVIHRDLKPENILVTEESGVKVIDFGIAQLTGDQISPQFHTAAGGVIGTPSYMSPEQKANPLKVSFNTDIFSLGILAYELIIGKLSYGHVQLDLLPKNLRPIFENALNPDPNKRYQDIVDFISDLSGYIKKGLSSDHCSREDELKDVWDTLGKKQQKMLPSTLPSWPDMEIGLSKTEGIYLFGLYFDFFRNSDGTYLICLAESPHEAVDSIIPIASLRGMIHSLMHPYSHSHQALSFDLPNFVFSLNQMFYHDPLQSEVNIAFLYLNPLHDEFSLISSGFEALWHLPSRGGAARHITNHSNFLGKQPNMEFFPTSDTWNSSDILVLHTFSPRPSQEQSFEETSRKLVTENQDLSPEASSKQILHYLKEAYVGPIETHQNIVLTLSRY